MNQKTGGGYQASKILVDHQLKKLAKDGEKKKKEELNKEKSALEKEKESNDKMFEGRKKKIDDEIELNKVYRALSFILIVPHSYQEPVEIN